MSATCTTSNVGHSWGQLCLLNLADYFSTLWLADYFPLSGWQIIFRGFYTENGKQMLGPWGTCSSQVSVDHWSAAPAFIELELMRAIAAH